MRIVIDLQGVQAESKWRNHLEALVLALAENSGDHEIWLALNASEVEGAIRTRRAFEGFVPNKRIHSYETVSPETDDRQSREDYSKISELIREYSLDQLNPDVILHTWVLNGSIDNYSSNSKKAGSSIDFPVLSLGPNLRKDIEQQFESDSSEYCFSASSTWYIKNSDRILTFSEEDSRQLASSFGIENVASLGVSKSIYPGKKRKSPDIRKGTNPWKKPAVKTIT